MAVEGVMPLHAPDDVEGVMPLHAPDELIVEGVWRQYTADLIGLVHLGQHLVGGGR